MTQLVDNQGYCGPFVIIIIIRNRTPPPLPPPSPQRRGTGEGACYIGRWVRSHFGVGGMPWVESRHSSLKILQPIDSARFLGK